MLSPSDGANLYRPDRRRKTDSILEFQQRFCLWTDEYLYRSVASLRARGTWLTLKARICQPSYFTDPVTERCEKYKSRNVLINYAVLSDLPSPPPSQVQTSPQTTEVNEDTNKSVFCGASQILQHPCSSERTPRFEVTYRLHLQGVTLRQTRNQPSLSPPSARFLLAYSSSLKMETILSRD
jgi:hypothetical protein